MFFRKKIDGRCRSISERGFRCRKKVGHEGGIHWWDDPGTGNGDEGMNRHTWTDSDEIYC